MVGKMVVPLLHKKNPFEKVPQPGVCSFIYSKKALIIIFEGYLITWLHSKLIL